MPRHISSLSKIEHDNLCHIRYFYHLQPENPYSQLSTDSLSLSGDRLWNIIIIILLPHYGFIVRFTPTIGEYLNASAGRVNRHFICAMIRRTSPEHRDISNLSPNRRPLTLALTPRCQARPSINRRYFISLLAQSIRYLLYHRGR